MTKCRKFKRVMKRVCADFRGGKKGVRGLPGKKCISYKKRAVKVCADFGRPGHGVLTSTQRERIRESIHAGGFGGKGTFKSLSACKAEVRSQKRRGIPYAVTVKRIVLPTKVFRKHKPNGIKRIGTQCHEYAKQIYGRK